jgi:predicted ATPase/class 3 adenylate cyclase
MTCPRCQAENDAGARFCEDCGARLEAACPSCGTPVTPGKKFCRSCGAALTPEPSRFTSPEAYTPKHLAEKILTSKAALEGERKQVTVLFADLKGSMELLADRDPEEARKLLDPVLERMMEAVHRYEGTVNQVMGDGIMALFGAPLAHEDHAVRACYAALRMQESVKQYAEEVFRSHGVPLQIRVGLNSGEVVVRAIGSDLHMDYTAVGQTTHLAARMEQMATPGTILLAPATLHLAEGYVQVASRGPVVVKGLPDPVEIYALSGASALRSRLHAAAARGFTRFVGRDSEIEQLHRALALAQDGHGQLVALVGEPGVGKSRLVYEFTHSHRTQEWVILEAGSVSYGKATSYLPVIDLLKAYFKVHDRETHREIREKVTGKLLTLDESLKPALPALLALLDVPVEDTHWQALDPAQRRQRTLDAVKHLLLRESQGQPVLVVFEDLHWIDSETQALLDSLVESLPTARVLLLINYRPEYQHGWVSKTYYSQLRLDALAPESAGEFLSALLGDDPGLEPLKRLLVRRGNPFFIEESIRTLVETQALTGERGAYRLTRPIQAIEVPATVQVILAARIDRLSADDKQLLQTASVIGKDVPVVLLHAVAEAAEEAVQRGLTHLQAAEFLYETQLFPDPEYTFKHALTHEVTYGTLLQDRRKALHARIVGAIERLHAGRLAEHAEQLAHHARLAEAWDKAGPYLREAGRRAFARSANREAADHFEHAAAAFDRLPQTREMLEHGIDVRFELRTALQVLRAFDRQQACLADALKLAETLKDQHRLGYALMFASLWATLDEDYAEGIRLGHRALDIGEALGELGIQAGACCYLGVTNMSVGRFPEAVRLCEAAIALIPPERIHERFGQSRPISNLARAVLGIALGRLGRFSDALAYATAAVQIAGEANSAYSLASSTYELGNVWLLKGEHENAVRELEHSIEVWQTLQAPQGWAPAVAAQGLAYCRMGRVSEGLALIQEGPEGLMAYQLPTGALSSEAYLLTGRISEAAAKAQGLLALAREKGQRASEADALRLGAEIAARTEPLDAVGVEQQYHAAMSLADELGMRPLVAHCHLGLGRLSRRTGKRELARDHLTTATTMYREMDMRFWLEQAEAEMRELA